MLAIQLWLIHTYFCPRLDFPDSFSKSYASATNFIDEGVSNFASLSSSASLQTAASGSGRSGVKMGTSTVNNPPVIFLCGVLCVLYRAPLFCHAASNFTTGQQIRDGQTIVSPNGDFALGFFSPGNSTARYVGVWYNNISGYQVVWVANRETPIVDKNGVLQIGGDGSLVVLNGNGTSIWTSNSSISSNTSIATLDNSGNINLRSDAGASRKSYWQSFNSPTDTYLPGMMVEVNAALGENRLFRSWKSSNDPSPGRYYLGVDPRGSPQIVVWDGTKRRWRSGHWTGIIFLGVPNMTTNLYYGFKVTPPGPDGSAYITYIPYDNSTLIRFWIRSDGIEEELRWAEDSKEWSVYQSQPANECEFYNRCGSFGICDISLSPICRCVQGFEPASKQQWSSGNWSGGCVRKTQLQCRANNGTGGGDGFTGEKCMKLPDFADHAADASDIDQCETHCSGNCSCNAYAYVSGIGCLTWSSVDLVDIQHFAGYGMQVTLNIRLDDSDLGGKIKISNLMIILITVGGTLFLGALIFLIWKFRAKLKVLPIVSTISWLRNNEASGSDLNNDRPISTENSGPNDIGIEGSGSELPMFSFSSIVAATNNFSEQNKLGQGGFGPVYKGKLPGGQEVAVKRLSRKSGQGLEEFKNEIILIAKLQHRNLVRLLGCCIEPEEKILLYEYMPNKSLDYFLFDPAKGALLDWRVRFNIIEGIARGILYLHRDSRLRIIHRDLKASNVLLDEDKNPKISDFGMARIFGGNQNEANTNRVVGTYGYMSPEYAMEGLFSVKSDVYSFGVLLLEIVSGRRNTSFRLSEHANLIGFAWHLWNEGKVMDLVDPSISDSSPEKEVIRCVQIGMLCVQDNAAYRPTMSGVVIMLESDSVHIDLPRQPTMTSMRSSIDTDNLLESQDVASLNEMTATMLVGR